MRKFALADVNADADADFATEKFAHADADTVIHRSYPKLAYGSIYHYNFADMDADFCIVLRI